MVMVIKTLHFVPTVIVLLERENTKRCTTYLMCKNELIGR